MENKKTHTIFKRIKALFNFLGWIVFTVLICSAAFLVMVLITNKIAESKGQKPIMGLYTIVSPSMTGSINVYDVVFVLKTSKEHIHRGDVITYKAENVIFGDTPVTHRIIEKYTDEQGQAVYVTKGDYNQFKDDFYAYERNIIGKVLFKIPQLGRIQFFLVGRKGWFVVVLLPALAIIAYDIFKILKVLLNGQTDNENEKLKIKENNENDLFKNNEFLLNNKKK